MKILRTILWVLGALGFLIFSVYNWQPVELTLWQNLVLETKVPMLALLAFGAGFLPMWALHRSITWSMGRRIRSLENSLKTAATARAQSGDVAPVETPVDKFGKSADAPGDMLSPADSTGSDGGSGK